MLFFFGSVSLPSPFPPTSGCTLYMFLSWTDSPFTPFYSCRNLSHTFQVQFRTFSCLLRQPLALTGWLHTIHHIKVVYDTKYLYVRRPKERSANIQSNPGSPPPVSFCFLCKSQFHVWWSVRCLPFPFGPNVLSWLFMVGRQTYETVRWDGSGWKQQHTLLLGSKQCQSVVQCWDDEREMLKMGDNLNESKLVRLLHFMPR